MGKRMGGIGLNDQFELVSKYKPQGDQPEAIRKIVEGIHTGKKTSDPIRGNGNWKNIYDF